MFSYGPLGAEGGDNDDVDMKAARAHNGTTPALTARRGALGTGRQTPFDTAVRSGTGGRNARAWHRRIAASSRIVFARAAWGSEI